MLITWISLERKWIALRFDMPAFQIIFIIQGIAIFTILEITKECLKKHSCNLRTLYTLALRCVSREFGCYSPLRRSHPGKIAHKL